MFATKAFSKKDPQAIILMEGGEGGRGGGGREKMKILLHRALNRRKFNSGHALRAEAAILQCAKNYGSARSSARS